MKRVMELYSYSDNTIVYSEEIKGKAILIKFDENLKVVKL